MALRTILALRSAQNDWTKVDGDYSMKIALTGSSSTGKTTLATALMGETAFRAYVDESLTTDARSILRAMGHQSVDKMSQDERRTFQRDYFARKMKGEAGKERFITDRSFVDVAAYWLRRDTVDAPTGIRAELLEPCSREAHRYALHVYCPFGVVPFKSDGYRSEDQNHHREIDAQTMAFLKEWGVHFITLDSDILSVRVEQVIQEMQRIAAVR